MGCCAVMQNMYNYWSFTNTLEDCIHSQYLVHKDTATFFVSVWSELVEGMHGLSAKCAPKWDSIVINQFKVICILIKSQIIL